MKQKDFTLKIKILNKRLKLTKMLSISQEQLNRASQLLLAYQLVTGYLTGVEAFLVSLATSQLSYSQCLLNSHFCCSTSCSQLQLIQCGWMVNTSTENLFIFLQDFFLSRVFGFSFYFPICLTRMEALEVASFGFLPPLLILMSVVTYTMM